MSKQEMIQTLDRLREQTQSLRNAEYIYRQRTAKAIKKLKVTYSK